MIKEKFEIWKKISMAIGSFFAKHLPFPAAFSLEMRKGLGPVKESDISVFTYPGQITLTFTS